MKKYFVKAACLCLCAGFVLAGCKKDDDDLQTSVIKDNKITVTAVENGSSLDINSVKAWIGNYEAAGSSYAGGKFALELPATVDDRYLDAAEDELDVDSWIKVSNRNAKLGGLAILGYKGVAGKGAAAMRRYEIGEPEDNEFVCFTYTSTSNSVTLIFGAYIYASEDVNVTGSYSETEDGIKTKGICSISLKKGWNMMYLITSMGISSDYEVISLTVELTTRPQSGMKWYYGDPIEALSSKSYLQESVAKFAGSKMRLLKGLK